MKFWNEILPMQTSPAFDEILLNEKVNHSDPSTSNPEMTDRVMLRRKRVSRIYYLKKFFDYPISLSIRTFKSMGIKRTLKAGFGYIVAKIKKHPEISLENFYINRFGKPLYQMFFEEYTEKVWGIHPSKLGADWGSQRIKGLSILGIIKNMIRKKFINKKKTENIETSLIEEFYYPKLGPGHFWESVAMEIKKKGGKIELQSSVKKVRIENSKVVEVTITDNDGKEKRVPCDYFISSMPIKNLIESIDGLNVPQEIKKIASHLPYRDFITVGLLVDKLKIKNQTKLKTYAERIPDTWIYVQEPNVRLGRIQIFNNWSPYMVKDYKNTVWIGLEYFCNEGDNLWEMTDKEFIGMAINELESIGIIDSSSVIESVRIKEKKAYPAYYGSYYEMDKVREFLDSIENLYCIGRNGQHRYNNMDHSMLTAIAAIDAISSDKNDKSLIWGVNTEKAYHETK